MKPSKKKIADRYLFNSDYFPVLFCASIALLFSIFPSFLNAAQFDRGAIVGNGEVQRLLTGHFCHWGWSHLFWDLTVFIAAGIMVLRTSKLVFWLDLVLTSCFSSCFLLFFRPEINVYRGLSGIDCALVMSSAVFLFMDANVNWKHRCVGLLVIMAIIGKSLWESIGHSAIFADGDFLLTPSTHLIGFTIGAALVLVVERKPSAFRRSVCGG